jgi:hypothetical protein
MDEEGRPLERYYSAPQTTEALLKYGNSIFTGAMLFRRELLESVGWMDTQWQTAADYDYVIRASRKHRLDHLPIPLAMFRMHAGSKTQYSKSLMWREALAISTRHSGRRQLSLYTRYWTDSLLHFIFPRSVLWHQATLPLRKLLRRLWRLGRYSLA